MHSLKLETDNSEKKKSMLSNGRLSIIVFSDGWRKLSVKVCTIYFYEYLQSTLEKQAVELEKSHSLQNLCSCQGKIFLSAECWVMLD